MNKLVNLPLYFMTAILHEALNLIDISLAVIHYMLLQGAAVQ